MAKVYIVTHGDYADYSILAAFSTREGADDYVENYNITSSWISMQAKVEEWELDEKVDLVAKNWWEVAMWVDTGESRDHHYGMDMVPRDDRGELTVQHTFQPFKKNNLIHSKSYVSRQHAWEEAQRVRKEILDGTYSNPRND